jgi:predicted ATPase
MKNNKNYTYKDLIIQILKNLDNKAHLSKIYQEFENIAKQENINLVKSYRAIIRGTLERHSSDSKAFNGKEVIFKIGVCIKRRKDIFFYDKLKRILKKHLAEKLQFLLPSEGNDKVIVFLTGKVS